MRGELARANQFKHVPNRLFQPDEDGAGNNRVPDIESVEMGHVLNIFADVVVVEAVPGVDLESNFVCKNGRAAMTDELFLTPGRGGGVGIGAGVQLDTFGS